MSGDLGRPPDKRESRPGGGGGNPKRPSRRTSEGGARDTAARRQPQELVATLEIVGPRALITRCEFDPGLTKTVRGMLETGMWCGACAGPSRGTTGSTSRSRSTTGRCGSTHTHGQQENSEKAAPTRGRGQR